jgi:hypothetical protein
VRNRQTVTAISDDGTPWPLTADREILIRGNQFLVFRDGIFEGRNEEVETLLTTGLDAKLLPRDRHLERRLLAHIAHRRVEERVHAAEQVVRLVGFGNVVVGPGIEATDDIDRVRARRTQDERHAPQGRVGLHRLAELISGHHRHLDVGDDDVRDPFLGQFQGLNAVLAPADRVAGLGKPLLEDLALDAAVFGDRHLAAAGHAVPRSSACVTCHDRTRSIARLPSAIT